MDKIQLKTSFNDERGDIIDLIENKVINAVTIVTFKEGAVRGNHYHKATTQWNYLISGKIMIRTQKPGEDFIDAIMNPGDFFVALPNEYHALKALEDAKLLVLTKGPRGGKEYESDTFRLKNPLI
jgi:quercetin dioxygenase-like cupin family protein